jgi:hypothetical protein
MMFYFVFSVIFVGGLLASKALLGELSIVTLFFLVCVICWFAQLAFHGFLAAWPWIAVQQVPDWLVRLAQFIDPK